jgi:hypothetical protein
MKKKTVVGYARPSEINDFVRIKSINKESFTSLCLRQTNLYLDFMLSMFAETENKPHVYKENKSLKKYKITIERIK